MVLLNIWDSNQDARQHITVTTKRKYRTSESDIFLWTHVQIDESTYALITNNRLQVSKQEKTNEKRRLGKGNEVTRQVSGLTQLGVLQTKGIRVEQELCKLDYKLSVLTGGIRFHSPSFRGSRQKKIVATHFQQDVEKNTSSKELKRNSIA